MKMKFLAPLALVLLAGCGGNPLGAGNGNGAGGDEGDPDTSAGSIYGDAVDVEALTANSIVYDETNDELVINNIPFDGISADNGQAAYVRNGSLPNGFGRYESVETGETGRRQYYAVFRRSPSGFAQASAVGTDSYVDFGFGGVTAQRTSTSIRLPGGGEYVYTGEYAAVVTYDKGQAGSPGGVQYITGDVELDVDIRDFDVTGAVEGIIFNRTLYAQDGSEIGALDNFISLATGEIDPDTRSVLSSTATAFTSGGASTVASGNWAAVFAGPDGQEVAGIVVLEGAVSSAPGSGSSRETGVFLTRD